MSVAVLVASQAPVDQYVIHHPEFVLGGQPEEARLDPDNLHVLLAHLRADGFLVDDSGLLMLGPAAERAFGRRHFMDLLSSFTSESELRVVAGTKEIGFISPLALPAGHSRLRRALQAGRAGHARAPGRQTRRGQAHPQLTPAPHQW